MTQYAFHLDGGKCTGCKTCQVACKETYKLPVNNLYRRVYNYQGGSWKPTEAGHYVPDGVFGYFVSLSCNHCTDPACVANCPTGAMQKDEETGIVWTDHDVCIGCKTCETACPYGAPTFGEDEGYMRALDWGPLDDMVAKYGEGDIEVEPLPQDTTGPNLILTPHPKAQKSGSGTGAVVNLEEEL